MDDSRVGKKIGSGQSAGSQREVNCDDVVRWSTDGKALLVGSATSQTVDRVDLVTGRREPLVTLGNQAPGATRRFIRFAMADDPHVYAYIAAAYLSEIFTVDGVR